MHGTMICRYVWYCKDMFGSADPPIVQACHWNMQSADMYARVSSDMQCTLFTVHPKAPVLGAAKCKQADMVRCGPLPKVGCERATRPFWALLDCSCMEDAHLGVCLRCHQCMGAGCVRLEALAVQLVKYWTQVANGKDEVCLQHSSSSTQKQAYGAVGVQGKTYMKTCSPETRRTAKSPGWGRASENMPSPGRTTEVAQIRAHSSTERTGDPDPCAVLHTPCVGGLGFRWRTHLALSKC